MTELIHQGRVPVEFAGEDDGRDFQAGGTACLMAWGPEKEKEGVLCD